MPKSRNTAETFKSRIQYSSGCWTWTGSVHKKGYGRFKENGYYWWAHRYAYQLWNGPLIKGKVIMHECDNKVCVNPEHLEQGTVEKNSEDAFKRGLNYKKGEDNQGHKLTEKQVLAIRAFKALGMSNVCLGEMFGVNRRTIYNIIHGKTWTHI